MSTQSKERLAVDLEFTDGGQIAVMTLVDTVRDNAMSPEMGDAFRAVVDMNERILTRSSMSSKIETKLGRRGFLKRALRRAREATCCSPSSRMRLRGESRSLLSTMQPAALGPPYQEKKPWIPSRVVTCWQRPLPEVS
jgi:hypothetical protein